MARTRLLRTIRFDASDERVFAHAAGPGEWAVSGAFAFADADPETLSGKRQQAFRSGFLGTGSFGWSTFVAVAEIDAAARQAAVARLADHLLAHYGAPDLRAAEAAAEQEVAFAEGLAEHSVNTLVAVERSFGADGLVERFRTVHRPTRPQHAKIWSLREDDEDG